jgi:hypothetical protein
MNVKKVYENCSESEVKKLLDYYKKNHEFSGSLTFYDYERYDETENEWYHTYWIEVKFLIVGCSEINAEYTNIEINIITDYYYNLIWKTIASEIAKKYDLELITQ